MAIIFTPATPVTDDEILELSRRNPGYQFERTGRGQLVVNPAGSESGRRSAQLLLQLGRWAEAAGGVVFDSSTGFRLADGSLFSPDASWVQRDQWETLSKEDREGFAPICPEAVFEIRSRTDALPDLRAKLQTYLTNGARLAVLIDPEGRTVHVYRRDAEPKVYHDPADLTFGPELPGFKLDLRPIFAE